MYAAWGQFLEKIFWLILLSLYVNYGSGSAAVAAAKSLQLCPTLCDPIDGSPPGSPIPGILQARTLEWVAISFPSAWKWKVKVKLLSRVRPQRPHEWQPTRLLHPWNFPGKSTGMGCHCHLVRSLQSPDILFIHCNNWLKVYNSIANTSKGVLFLSPSDIYVRSFLTQKLSLHTLIKLYYTKALSNQGSFLLLDWILLLQRPRIPVSFVVQQQLFNTLPS